MTMIIPVASARKLTTHRKALMLSCAAAAVAAAVANPHQAQAQAVPQGAFQGSILGNPSNASRAITGTGTETITVTGSTATIDWAPDESGSGNINFLPNGNVATFVGAQGLADYTVLNRVVPDGARAIELNGKIFSKLDGGATGGKIWFYSPNGIVVGSTAVFDVGGLLLTTQSVDSFANNANGFTANLSGVNPAATVEIQSGAQIKALANNSYVALVAPRIEQRGSVQVNGSAAYVAAEQLTMTMNQGLFDLQVAVGTSDPNGVVHAGSELTIDDPVTSGGDGPVGN